MCHECKALLRQIDALKAGNAVLRANNMTLDVAVQIQALLKQDASHAAKIREHIRYESKLEGLLQLASRVLLNGDKAERDDVAVQIQALLDAGIDPG
jgi:hypothetical protein